MSLFTVEMHTHLYIYKIKSYRAIQQAPGLKFRFCSGEEGTVPFLPMWLSSEFQSETQAWFLSILTATVSNAFAETLLEELPSLALFLFVYEYSKTVSPFFPSFSVGVYLSQQNHLFSLSTFLIPHSNSIVSLN